MSFSFTPYFEAKVLAKRPYLTRAMCVRVVRDPVRVELQSDGQRVRFWARVPELDGRVLRSEIRAMRIEYFPETDSLYIEFTARPGADSREIDDGIVIDVDADGHVIGIDIDQASKHLDLGTLDIKRIPLGAERAAG